MGIIHALEFELRADKYMAFIIWPETPPTTVRLISSRKTWLTAKAGDAVLVNDQRHFIEEVRLYRVDPAGENGQTVQSGQAWIDGEVIGESNKGRRRE